jgi:uncharacterized membrane protein (DUF485 family)
LIHIIVIGLVVYYRYIVLKQKSWLVHKLISFLKFYLSWYLKSIFCEIHLAAHKNTGQNNNIAIIIGLSDNISINWVII